MKAYRVNRKKRKSRRMEVPEMTPSQQLMFLAMKEEERKRTEGYNQNRQYAYVYKEKE